MRLTSSRWLVLIAGAIVVLLVAGVLVVALRPPRAAAEGMPESVVRSFFEAIIEGDATLARATMTESLAAVCTTERLQWPMRWYSDPQSDYRIEVTHSRSLSDGRVRVDARITRTTVRPPFSVSESTNTSSLELAEDAGTWRLDAVRGPAIACP
jgi:hypothetical protein